MNRFRLCSYPAHDYRGAEDFLNQQAAEGWALDAFYVFPLGVAKFVPTERTDLRYCIELTNSKDWDDNNYLELCRDAGWEEFPLPTRKAWRVFRSIPGADPVPLQTDPAMELERFFRKRLRWDLLAVVIAVPLLALYFWWAATLPHALSWSAALFKFISSGYGLAILLAALVGGPTLLWEIGSELRYWLRCRKVIREGLEFPAPSQRESRRRVWGEAFYHSIYLLYLVFLILNLFDLGGKTYQPERWDLLREKPVVMAQDLGITDAELPCTLKETATPFYRVYDFEDRNVSYYLTVYTAATEPLARLAVTGLREQYYYFALSKADLGFDESYCYTPDQNSSYRVLLLRQGKTTALLYGNADWTDPDILGVLWERLQLKE